METVNVNGNRPPSRGPLPRVLIFQLGLDVGATIAAPCALPLTVYRSPYEEPAMPTIDLPGQLEEVVTANDLVLVDFWAPWCGPATGFAPVFEAAAEKYPDVVFAEVNTDRAGSRGSFRHTLIPTLMGFERK